jgi:LysM repeat protein
MTLAQIKEINNLTDEDKIIPGQKIKVLVKN